MEIKGYVTDPKGVGIPYVNIYIKEDTIIGTTSDTKGFFSIDALAGQHLVFSHIGMKKQEVQVPSFPASLSIILQEEEIALPETTVTYTPAKPKNPPSKTTNAQVVPSYNDKIKRSAKWLLLGLLGLSVAVVWGLSSNNNKPKKVEI